MADNGRRSVHDIKWQETKALVDKRDKRRCQFEKCLSIKEAHQLKPGLPKTLDRAHIFAASSHPDQIYNVANIITLRRYLHRRMDEYKHPLDESTISYNENRYWWWRIATKAIEEYDDEIDYELLLKDLINP